MADFVLVCVPTPVDHDHKPDLGPLHKSSVAIGRGLQPGTVVSYESTTFPGCTERECIPLLERESGLKAGEDFGVSYCPERLNPGDDAHTTEVTPRVLGALDERSYRIAESVYNSFLAVPVHKCRDIRTAEASKVLENVQRDVNIALMNEFAMMCPALGLDVHEVLRAARSKFNFVRVDPGPGVGGHCIPVDPWYLIEEARAHGIEPGLMVMARKVNDAATDAVADAILGQLAGRAGAKVAVLGAAYKGGVGDLRESPALRIVDLLRPRVQFLSVHDPYIEDGPLRTATHADPATVEEAFKDADAIALVTDHPEFKGLDWMRLAGLAKPGASVFDARNLLDPATAASLGLRYWGIGRSSA
jgi:nucleotide sugar dehydrogenase